MDIENPELVAELPEGKDLNLWRVVVREGDDTRTIHVEIFGSAAIPEDVSVEEVVIARVRDTYEALPNDEQNLDGLAALGTLHIASTHTEPWWGAAIDNRCPNCSVEVDPPMIAVGHGTSLQGIRTQYIKECPGCGHELVRDTDPGSRWLDRTPSE